MFFEGIIAWTTSGNPYDAWGEIGDALTTATIPLIVPVVSETDRQGACRRSGKRIIERITAEKTGKKNENRSIGSSFGNYCADNSLGPTSRNSARTSTNLQLLHEAGGIGHSCRMQEDDGTEMSKHGGQNCEGL